MRTSKKWEVTLLSGETFVSESAAAALRELKIRDIIPVNYAEADSAVRALGKLVRNRVISSADTIDSDFPTKITPLDDADDAPDIATILDFDVESKPSLQVLLPYLDYNKSKLSEFKYNELLESFFDGDRDNIFLPVKFNSFDKDGNLKEFNIEPTIFDIIVAHTRFQKYPAMTALKFMHYIINRRDYKDLYGVDTHTYIKEEDMNGSPMRLNFMTSNYNILRQLFDIKLIDEVDGRVLDSDYFGVYDKLYTLKHETSPLDVLFGYPKINRVYPVDVYGNRIDNQIIEFSFKKELLSKWSSAENLTYEIYNSTLTWNTAMEESQYDDFWREIAHNRNYDDTKASEVIHESLSKFVSSQEKSGYENIKNLFDMYLKYTNLNLLDFTTIDEFKDYADFLYKDNIEGYIENPSVYKKSNTKAIKTDAPKKLTDKDTDNFIDIHLNTWKFGCEPTFMIKREFIPPLIDMYAENNILIGYDADGNTQVDSFISTMTTTTVNFLDCVQSYGERRFNQSLPDDSSDENIKHAEEIRPHLLDAYSSVKLAKRFYNDGGSLEVPTKQYVNHDEYMTDYVNFCNLMDKLNFNPSSVTCQVSEGGCHINFSTSFINDFYTMFFENNKQILSDSLVKKIEEAMMKNAKSTKTAVSRFYDNLRDFILKYPSVVWAFTTPYDTESCNIVKKPTGKGHFIVEHTERIELRFFQMPESPEEMDLFLKYARAIMSHIFKITLIDHEDIELYQHYILEKIPQNNAIKLFRKASNVIGFDHSLVKYREDSIKGRYANSYAQPDGEKFLV